MVQSEIKEQLQFTISERWVLVATITASSMAFIDSSALNVALASVQASLKASGAQLLWVINAYLLMLASLILVGGSLGDKLGKKSIYGWRLLVFTGIIGMRSFSYHPMDDYCPGHPGCRWSINDSGQPFHYYILHLPQPDVGKAFGIWSAATTLVTIVGPILGGFFADHGFWRGVFLINLPIGIVALLALLFKVAESKDEAATGKIDFLGAALITISLAGLTYGFISAPDYGFQAPGVFIPLIVGVCGMVAFVLVEARKRQPMMPLHLFKSRTFAGTNLLTLFLYGGLSAGTFFLSLNMVQVQGYSKTEAGLAFIPFALILTALSRWSGGLVDRSGPRLPLILGPALAGAGFFWMAFSGVTRGPSDYWTTFFPGIVLFGIGMGFTVAPLTTSVMGSVASHYSGVASGINNAVSRTAGVLAIAIIGSIALFIFASSLDSRTSGLSLNSVDHKALMVEATKLGGASVPVQIETNKTASVELAIKQSFADTFRAVMLISAAMAWISALLSASLVEEKLYRQVTG